MAEALSQAKIDELLSSLNDEKNYENVSYHNLICVHCHRLIRFFDTNTHCYISSEKCKCKPLNCTFVSASWLKAKKLGQYGWNRKDALVADIKSQKTLKEIDGGSTGRPRRKAKPYVRSPNEKVIYSCSIWDKR